MIKGHELRAKARSCDQKPQVLIKSHETATEGERERGTERANVIEREREAARRKEGEGEREREKERVRNRKGNRQRERE